MKAFLVSVLGLDLGTGKATSTVSPWPVPPLKFALALPAILTLLTALVEGSLGEFMLLFFRFIPLKLISVLLLACAWLVSVATLARNVPKAIIVKT
jgi:hypothetical protein